MTPTFRFVTDDITGHRRAYRRLTQHFLLVRFTFETGLREHLLAACRDSDDLGFRLTRVLYLHACGLSGPIPVTDRLLNYHILGTLEDGHQKGRWVVSRHRIRGVLIEIASDACTGETRIRRPDGTAAVAAAVTAKEEEEEAHA